MGQVPEPEDRGEKQAGVRVAVGVLAVIVVALLLAIAFGMTDSYGP